MIDVGDAAGDGTISEVVERGLEEIGDARDLVRPALAPHAIYTVSEPSLRWFAEASEDRGLPVQIHLSETEEEVTRCVSEHSVRPAAYLDRVGLLGPANGAGPWRMAGRGGAGADRGAWRHRRDQPRCQSQARRRGGVSLSRGAAARRPRRPRHRRGRAPTTRWTCFQDLKTFALLQKHEARDPAAVPAREAWEVATGRRSPLLGGSGTVAVGEPADFLLLRAGAPELEIGDFTADLVYAASGSVVDTTVVNGEVLMREGRVEGADEVLARALEQARRLGLAS